jgi:hypothetical protein
VGILALPHNPSGSYFSLLNYIDKSILTKGFKYRIEYHSPSGVVLDNTDRNLCQIMTEGYQGNRLDLMVGNYSVHLVFDNRDLLLGNRYKGSMILSSLNALFNLIRELDQKYYLDVCFERKETLLDEALFISKSNRQSL